MPPRPKPFLPVAVPAAATRAEHWLTRMVDAGLAGVAFLVPFTLGGRGAVGEAVVVLLALYLAVCWCLKQAVSRQPDWISSAATPILLVAMGLILLQIVPLPPSLLTRLSPHLKEILPLWSSSTGDANLLGAWRTISLEPDLTRSCLTLVGSLALIFLVAVQRIRSLEDIERLLRLVAVATVAVAALGLVQFLFGNGKFFWFYEDPYSDTNHAVKGCFVCRNHFADFIAVGIGAVLWWLLDAVSGSRLSTANSRLARPHCESAATPLQWAVRSVAIVICALAVLLSLSRGGFVALCVAIAVSVACLYRARVVHGKALLGTVALAALVGIVAVGHGYERVVNRLNDFQSLETLDGATGRRTLWLADLGAVRDYRLCGTGLGTHREVSPMYFARPGADYSHAENGYIQVAMEAGLPGLLVVCSTLALYCYWCIRLALRSQNRRVLLALTAIAPALAATAVHSLFDFVWYIPGCMTPVVLLGACACRLWQVDSQMVAGTLRVPSAGRPSARGLAADYEMDRCGRRSVPAPLPTHRILWIAATACLLLVASAILPSALFAIPAERHWHSYLVQSRATMDKEDSTRTQACREMLATTSSVVKWQPRHSRAHVRLAALHFELFERLQSQADPPFSVAQIRDAAIASQFSSSSALRDWLGRVAGPNLDHLHKAWSHARQAAALCPLHGTAYLLLAKLSFLEGPQSPGKAAYVTQALKVQPLDADVRFEAGLESVLAGDMDQATEHWRISFQTGPQAQLKLLETLSQRVPASVFLNEFQPDLDALGRIAAHYAKLGRKDELAEIRQRYAQALVIAAEAGEGREAAALWQRAAGVYVSLGAQDDRIRCLRRAVVQDPSWFDARLQLAKAFLETEQLPEAERELLDCRRQRPYDKDVKSLLDRVVDQRLRLTRRP